MERELRQFSEDRTGANALAASDRVLADNARIVATLIPAGRLNEAVEALEGERKLRAKLHETAARPSDEAEMLLAITKMAHVLGEQRQTLVAEQYLAQFEGRFSLPDDPKSEHIWAYFNFVMGRLRADLAKQGIRRI